MSIKEIQVIKPKNKILYVPYLEALHLTESFKNLNVISIGDKYDQIYDLHPCKRRLILNTISTSHDMTYEDYTAVHKFIESLNGESLIVHCDQGRSRSPWLSRYIINRYPNYTFDYYLMAKGVY